MRASIKLFSQPTLRGFPMASNFKPGDRVTVTGTNGHCFNDGDKVTLLNRVTNFSKGKEVWRSEGLYLGKKVTQLLFANEDFTVGKPRAKWKPIEYSTIVDGDRLYTVQWDGMHGKWFLIDNEGDYGEWGDNRIGSYDTTEEAFAAFEVHRNES